MHRRSFFKSLALGAAALLTPKITRLEAEAASEIRTPKPLLGFSAYVTTVKGLTPTVQHNLRSSCVSVVACDFNGNYRTPRVEYLDQDRIKLTFTEPWHLLNRRKVYKVVVSSLLRSRKQ